METGNRFMALLKKHRQFFYAVFLYSAVAVVLWALSADFMKTFHAKKTLLLGAVGIALLYRLTGYEKSFWMHFFLMTAAYLIPVAVMAALGMAVPFSEMKSGLLLATAIFCVLIPLWKISGGGRHIDIGCKELFCPLFI